MTEIAPGILSLYLNVCRYDGPHSWLQMPGICVYGVNDINSRSKQHVLPQE